MTKLSARTQMGAAIADDDKLHLVDKSDTTQGANGSSYYINASQLKTYINGEVKNTVFVSKSGDDTTAAVERFDKPFLTISAAITATNIAFPSRTVDSRVLIEVERGNYVERINLYPFIDFNLKNCTITDSSISFEDALGTFSVPSDGLPTNIIYGKPIIYGDIYQTKTSVLFFDITAIYGYTETLSLYGGGTINITAKIIKSYIASLPAQSQPIALGGSAPSTLIVNNANICNTETTGALSVIVANGNLATTAHKLLLNSCQIANYAATESAITVVEGATGGKLDLTLINSIIWNKYASYSISKGLAASTLNVRCMNSYSNKPVDISTLAPTVLINTLTVDSNVEFNQNNLF